MKRQAAAVANVFDNGPNHQQPVSMATTIVMDTHKLVEDLEASGFSRQQATGITRALRQIDLSQLVTKNDLRDTELRLMKWTATVVGVGVAVLALLKFL